MGRLVDGKWETRRDDASSPADASIASRHAFRNWVTADGRPGSDRRRRVQGRARPLPPLCLARLPLGAPHADLPQAEEAHRRDQRLGRRAAHARRRLGVQRDLAGSPLRQGRLYEIYQMANPDHTGRASVPVLWDKERKTIVSNESAEIIRMLNSAFDAFGDPSLDFYPEPHRLEIDALNAVVYENINNGVYKAGFAPSQEAYEEAFRALFNTLDELDQRLDEQRFLIGDALTEADWRLFTTLIRFDAVYYVHFKLQPAADSRLPEPLRLSSRTLPDAGRKGDGRHRAHQAALLFQPRPHQSDPHRAARTAPDHRCPARPRPFPWDQPSRSADRVLPVGRRRLAVNHLAEPRSSCRCSYRRAARRAERARRQRSRGSAIFKCALSLPSAADVKGDMIADVGVGVAVHAEKLGWTSQHRARLLARSRAQAPPPCSRPPQRRRRASTSRRRSVCAQARPSGPRATWRERQASCRVSSRE